MDSDQYPWRFLLNTWQCKTRQPLKALLWVMLVTGFSTRKRGYNPRSFYVGFLVENLALGQVLLLALLLFPLSTIPPIVLVFAPCTSQSHSIGIPTNALTQFYIKTFFKNFCKNAPTCFDHSIIIRELSVPC